LGIANTHSRYNVVFTTEFADGFEMIDWLSCHSELIL
jgi:hypothetical protein